MIPIGTLVNIFAVICGSLLGLSLKKIIDIDMNKKIFFVMGLFTIVLGLSMTIETMDFIFILISIVIGTFLGEYYNIDGAIINYINMLKQKLGIKDANFTDGLVTAFLLYCIGSMTIVGSIDEGLGNPPSILYTKSIMDGISSIVLASTFGVGVIFSIFPMLIFQGGITLLVFIYKDIFPQELIHHINSVGGILIIAIGFKILGYKKINPTNMLPSLVVIFVLYIIKTSLL
tara:strand:+ start:2186 stop:2878 length:693 start_codon:yes stop_codon:yes gene_type:complete